MSSFKLQKVDLKFYRVNAGLSLNIYKQDSSTLINVLFLNFTYLFQYFININVGIF